jgi:hypothetical protein
MKRLLIAGAAALALSACNLFPAITPSPSVQITVTKADYAFEVTYNAAANLYLAAAPNLPPTVKSQAKAILLVMLSCPAVVTPAAPCTGYVQLARNATAAGDATTLASEVAQITTLAGEVTSLVKPQ